MTATNIVESAKAATLIPIINVKPFLDDPSSPAAAAVVDEVRKACLYSGFFQVTGHGIPESTQRGALDAITHFFGLAPEVKAKVHIKDCVGHRGWDPVGQQVLPDIQEGYFVGQEVPLDHPTVGFLCGPNVWPDMPESEFKDPVWRYYEAVRDLSIMIFQIVAKSLPHGQKAFQRFAEGQPVAALRLLHYPVCEAKEGQNGSTAHTDYGAVTVLKQFDRSGLQVQDPTTKEWVSVPPRADAFVVNLGDMLARWTSGLYKSPVHRVLAQTEKDRYSAAMFFNGNLDCKLYPVDGSKTPDEVPVSAKEHLIQCLTGMYGPELIKSTA